MVGVGRGELTDKAWAQIQPLLPAGGQPGGRWSDHRMVIDGILEAGLRRCLADLPERYGPWTTCHDRYVRWRRDGTSETVLGPCPDQVGCGGRG